VQPAALVQRLERLSLTMLGQRLPLSLSLSHTHTHTYTPARNQVLRGAALLHSAKRLLWRVSWIGDTGRNAGATTAGFTGWQQISSTSAIGKRLL
jgi:hypothetical protein